MHPNTWFVKSSFPSTKSVGASNVAENEIHDVEGGGYAYYHFLFELFCLIADIGLSI